jgi:hypothetical protein
MTATAMLNAMTRRNTINTSLSSGCMGWQYLAANLCNGTDVDLVKNDYFEGKTPKIQLTTQKKAPTVVEAWCVIYVAQ